MRFITLQTRPHSGLVYLNIDTIVTIVPLSNPPGARIVVSTGSVWEVTNTVAEVFERLAAADDVALDGVDATEIDLEGV